MAAARKTQSDSFFIRGRVNAGNSNDQGITTIDLGAYVDALGQSVLRIHKIAVEVADLLGGTITMNATSGASVRMALTTSYPSAALTSPILSDNSTICTGHLSMYNPNAGPEVAGSISDDFAQMDEAWRNGYLVAVDNIYLSGIGSSGMNEDAYIAIALECTVEKLDERSAIALALSQSQNQ
jgi:orotate phosphoribosyltransferase-like protein